VALGALTKLVNAKLISDTRIVSMLLNPASLRITRTAQWTATSNLTRVGGAAASGIKSGGPGAAAGAAAGALGGGGSDASTAVGHAPLQYRGSGPGTLTMTVLFDQSLIPAGDVSGSVDQLQNWTCPTVMGPLNTCHPPKVTFTWGEFRFVGHVTSVAIDYQLFGIGGRPLRATATVVLSENPDTFALTNPTSGGIAGRRIHVVSDGDSLQSIAFAEYGKPSQWRVLAEANGIDDPLRVAPGTALLIPPPRSAPEPR
jgi:contractile injection system tube protein